MVVHFEDGRPFHDFDIATNAAATHLCGEDLYEVQYTFAQWPIWSSQWRVRGPRKDLILKTNFFRDAVDTPNTDQ